MVAIFNATRFDAGSRSIPNSLRAAEESRSYFRASSSFAVSAEPIFTRWANVMLLAALLSAYETADLTPAGDRSRWWWSWARRRNKHVSAAVLVLALFAFGAGGAAFVVDSPVLMSKLCLWRIAQRIFLQMFLRVLSSSLGWILFLEVLASGASSMGTLVTGPIFTNLTGSESVIFLSGRFGDFPLTKASLASMLDIICARPDIFAGALGRTLALYNIALVSFFRTFGMIRKPVTRSQLIDRMRRAREGGRGGRIEDSKFLIWKKNLWVCLHLTPSRPAGKTRSLCLGTGVWRVREVHCSGTILLSKDYNILFFFAINVRY